MPQTQRVRQLRGFGKTGGRRVIYWMQASVRTRFNHALEYALFRAVRLSLPLDVLFVVTPSYPGATARPYRFLVEGLADTRDRLADRGIPFHVFVGDPAEVVSRRAADAALLVMDRGYLRHQRQWRQRVSNEVRCEVVEVESNVVVPVETAGEKEEYSAATIRRKIHRLASPFMGDVPIQDATLLPAGARAGSASPATTPGPGRPVDVAWLTDTNLAVADLGIRSNTNESTFPGGESAARRQLTSFLRERLEEYDTQRNDPVLDRVSNLSPYLHFGHISPVEIARAAIEYVGFDPSEPFPQTGHAGLDALLEELIVRRELAINFVHFNDRYDQYESLPDWAKTTLAEHQSDERPHIYDPDELRAAATHDPYWNACQVQMVRTGKMHGYMRMYWGKKILEWSETPRRAYATALQLNDEFELDGRDPNGYAGVAWCFGKHDRPWTEREIFGKVRYMNDRGLRRKFKIDTYAERWGTLR